MSADAFDFVAEGLSRWKELGALGVLLLALIKMGGKVLDWGLDVLGIKIKRGQSREDILGTALEKLTVEQKSQGARLTKIEQAYKGMAATCHKCADGIEEEMRTLKIQSPAIEFFVSQLREVQSLEAVLSN